MEYLSSFKEIQIIMNTEFSLSNGKKWVYK